VIIIIFLIHGIQQYISKAEDMTIQISMSLINGLLIYLILKYCHYKFKNLLPRYINDIKPGEYENLMDNCFDGEIPIKSYSSDINKYKYTNVFESISKMIDSKKYDINSSTNIFERIGKSTANAGLTALKPIGSMIATPIIKPLNILSKPVTDHVYDSKNKRMNTLSEIGKSLKNNSVFKTAKNDFEKGIKNIKDEYL
jgi:hypothetical protein